MNPSEFIDMVTTGVDKITYAAGNYSPTDPDEVPLESTCLRSASHNPLLREMVCNFTDGTSYEYYGVSTTVFLRMIGSGSVGRYFNYNVRNRYPYTQI